MLPANNDDQKVPETTVLVGKMQMRISNFNGKVTTFYRLHTRKLKRLNCTIESYYCDLKNKTTILFQFSPKAIDHDV